MRLLAAPVGNGSDVDFYTSPSPAALCHIHDALHAFPLSAAGGLGKHTSEHRCRTTAGDSAEGQRHLLFDLKHSVSQGTKYEAPPRTNRRSRSTTTSMRCLFLAFVWVVLFLPLWVPGT